MIDILDIYQTRESGHIAPLIAESRVRVWGLKADFAMIPESSIALKWTPVG
jgi:hypothetical protein